MKILQGVVHGKLIELADDPGLGDGKSIELVILEKPNDIRSVENPLLGFMADEPDLMDEIMDSIHTAREQHPLRLGEDG